MKTVKLILAGFLLSTLFSCATVEPIEDTSEELDVYGCSLLPPQENGWVVLRRDRRNVVMGRSALHMDETYAAFLEAEDVHTVFSEVGMTVGDASGGAQPDIERLSEYITRHFRSGYSSDRYQIMTLQVDSHRHLQVSCVLSYSIVKDFRPVRRSGSRHPMLLKAYDLLCMHPTLPDTLVRMNYSHRYYPSSEDSRLEEKARSWMKTMRFTGEAEVSG